ncbi:hypothetical protein [Ensifer sp. Root127]|uniref:hypothetical protein n=1 Tax=Ensifer sp. Root127 TaxID=1736440 RepID=UPI0009E94F40|nr:hypothetical protein [Ensifer sp. Root127]
MPSNEAGWFSRREAQPLLEVSEYRRHAGVDEAEERRLITLLGRYASRHELQMNIIRSLRRVR